MAPGRERLAARRGTGGHADAAEVVAVEGSGGQDDTAGTTRGCAPANHGVTPTGRQPHSIATDHACYMTRRVPSYLISAMTAALGLRVGETHVEPVQISVSNRCKDMIR
jgi:hypothetical protein